MHWLLCFGVVLCLVFPSKVTSAKRFDASNCEVCMKFLGSFIESLQPSDRETSEKIKEAFMKKCSTSVGKDNDFCYHVGGLKTSAASTLNRLVDPIKWQMPVEKVCQKLFELDSQICDLRYEKVIDLKEFDFKKSKVRDLKKIIEKWGLECRGCSEKSDFIQLIKSNIHKYDSDAATYLEARNEL
uniref:Mesencephalic astrocyte-derived neurotrophic factor homolog n=1 Tax=Trichobilharzia regenti TaxID=157069 RepID=A0AA85IM81_TRIRE|nr:unnamed protein product [Trichobilharzia regenti]